MKLSDRMAQEIVKGSNLYLVEAYKLVDKTIDQRRNRMWRAGIWRRIKELVA